MAEAPLRLSLDVTAVPARPVGAGQYTQALASALCARPDVELLLWSRRSDGARWRHLAPRAAVMDSAPRQRPLRLAWEQARLPGLITRSGAEVHHGPHYTMPERSRLPVVVTVHDLSFFVDPGWHERSKLLVFRRAIAVAARRAAAIVCPSLVTASEMARFCHLDAEVFVAHHGVDTARFAPVEPAPGSDRDQLAGVDARLGAGAPYLLFVGTLEPRKDVPTLVSAFARLAPRHRDAVLVLAGGPGWGAAAVEHTIAASGCSDRVVVTGYVGDEMVPALLRECTAAVYPAFYEGFGLPALEALACGAPLITTAGTAMEEVAGEAAILVPPGDAGALADAAESVLDPADGESGPEARRQSGIGIAARHTWARSAEDHLAAYRHAVTIGARSARSR